MSNTEHSGADRQAAAAQSTANPSAHASGQSPASGNVDAVEVERFSRLAAEWWNPLGKFRPLHQIGPPRLSFIRERAVTYYGLDATAIRALEGFSAIDIGCGGGLVAEPLARLGARVTGIDPSERNIAIATSHAEAQGLAIDYRAATIEDVVATGETFDIVACLEVVEHVPDVPAFISTCAKALKPGGLAVFSTINRNFKSWALAIVGAEYVLGWLPRGTHQWDRFITTDEMTRHLENAGLTPGRFAGIVYSPLRDEWSLSHDTDVNYLVSATRPA